MVFRKKPNLPERVRPLEPDGSTRQNASSATPAKLSRAIGAAAAVGVALLFVSSVADRGESTPPPPTLAPIETPERPPLQATTAVGAFQDFIVHAHQGETGRALALLADELPDVLGLGTVQYPNVAATGLWEDGRLDRRQAKHFVDEISELESDVIVHSCDGFADGPRVIITRCSYSLVGESQSAEESGRLFGVMVEGKVAGLIQQAEEKDAGPTLRRGRSGAVRI